MAIAYLLFVLSSFTSLTFVNKKDLIKKIKGDDKKQACPSKLIHKTQNFQNTLHIITLSKLIMS
jgi:hypothetical protein